MWMRNVCQRGMVDCLLKLLDSVRAVDLTVFSDAREWCWASLFEGRVIDARVLVI